MKKTKQKLALTCIFLQEKQVEQMEQEPQTCEKIPQLLLKYANAAAAFAVSVSQSSREVGAADANGMQPRAQKRSSNRAKCDSNATRQDLNAAVSAADGDDTHACKLLVHVQGKVNVVYCISSLVSAPSLVDLTYNSQASQGLSQTSARTCTSGPCNPHSGRDS